MTKNLLFLLGTFALIVTFSSFDSHQVGNVRRAGPQLQEERDLSFEKIRDKNYHRAELKYSVQNRADLSDH